GLAVVRKNYAATVEKGRLAPAEMEQRLALIRGTLAWEVVADADIVVEAVFEEMAVKQEVFGRLDRLCKPTAILATNTSTLDVDRIAQATARPGQVIGTHFFSPANVMRLLELVRAARPTDLRYSPVADWLCERGRFGQKTGAGWYRYEPGSRTPRPDPEVAALIAESARAQGIRRREVGDEEVLTRCLYPLVNEGARL